MGRRSKSRSLISTHNLLIILCLILIAVSVHILLSEDEEEVAVGKVKEQAQAQSQSQTQSQTQTTAQNEVKNTTTNNQVIKKDDVKVVQSNSKDAITEKEAIKLAKKQFKELKESWISDKDLEVVRFSRANEYYYYISSKENTIEIKEDGGKITRINSVPVD